MLPVRTAWSHCKKLRNVWCHSSSNVSAASVLFVAWTDSTIFVASSNMFAQPSLSIVTVPSEASTMRAVNHTQTQQSGCLVLQVENNSNNSRDRDEGSVFVDSACEVHLTDRNLVKKSGQKIVPSSPLNIIAARTALYITEKPSCTSR